jgi:hypothetical protein
MFFENLYKEKATHPDIFYSIRERVCNSFYFR